MWPWLLHVIGADNGAGKWYLFWSGFGANFGELAIAGSLLSLYKKHNCHTRWCWRVGHHDFVDPGTGVAWKLCRRHHPGVPLVPPTAEDIERAYQDLEGDP